MSALRKNVASQVITFCLISTTTGLATAGATFTAKAWVTGDGTQAGFGGTFTDLGNGQYKYVPTQAETNVTSFGILIAPTNVSVIPVNIHCFTANYDTTAANLPVNVIQINSVSTSPVTTVKAVQGLAVDGVVTTVTIQLTAAAIATGVWTDTTANDFTVALSVGKSVMNGVSLGTGLTVAAVTGLTASNLDTTVSSRMATYTQPTGFLAATFPAGTVANTTNITAATGITLATNSDKTGYALTSVYDFAKGTVAMTESYAANTVAPTAVQALFAIHQMLQDFAISGTNYTVYKLDHVTTAFVGTLDSATVPTTLTRV